MFNPFNCCERKCDCHRGKDKWRECWYETKKKCRICEVKCYEEKCDKDDQKDENKEECKCKDECKCEHDCKWFENTCE